MSGTNGPFTDPGVAGYDWPGENIGSAAVSRLDGVDRDIQNLLDAQDAALLAERALLASSLQELANWTPDEAATGQGMPIAPPLEVTSPTFDFDGVDEVPATDITAPNTTLGGLVTIPTLDQVTVDPFSPSVTGLAIPEAPIETTEAAPTAPTVNEITLPATPSLSYPTLPVLDQITIPTFTPLNLPVFDATAPEFEGTEVVNVLQWANPEYAVEVIDEVIAQLRDMWAGGNGIPPAVEQAIWERAANREDLDTARQLSAATTEFASRGFTMPPGMLVARTDAIREESQIKKQSANRDAAIRMAEIHVENVRFACEQGVAAETVLFNIWNNIAQRQFDAARIQLEMQLSMYNAQVSLFNAQQQGYAVEAQVFKARLDAELANVEVFRAQVEAQVASGQLNEQRARVYGEQVRGLLARVEVYKGQLQGAEIQSTIERNKIEGYRAEVQAYAEKIGAAKFKFDAYDSRVRGELGKAQIVDAEARAYASYVSGVRTIAEIDIKRMEGAIATNQQKIQEYTARLQGDRATIEAQVATSRAMVDAYQAKSQQYVASTGRAEAVARTDLAAHELAIRTSLQAHETEIRKYTVLLENLQRQGETQLEALRLAVQTGATLVAGTTAGRSIGLSLSGSAAVSHSAAESRAASWAKQRSDSYSEGYSTVTQLE